MMLLPWWLLLSGLHAVGLVVLWRYRRSDHPWLIRLLGAQWLALALRGLLAPVGQGGLSLLGDPTVDAVGARVLLCGADVLAWAVLALTAQRLAGGRFPGRIWWIVGAVGGGISAVGASPGAAPWPPAWQTVLVYSVVAPVPLVFATVWLLSHLRDCLRRRITVDLLALALSLVIARLLLVWVDGLGPGPLVHPAFELLFHSVSMVALFCFYGVSKRSVWIRSWAE